MAGNEVEKKAEELLEAIGVELAKSREKYADDILSGKEIPLYAEPMQKKRSARKRMRTIMILVAVLIMMMGLFVTSVTGVRERIFNYFAEKGSVSTQIKPFEQSDSTGKLPNFELTYLPEGYSLSSEDYEKSVNSKMYVSDENKYIYMTVRPSSTYAASVDNETMQGETTRVSIYQAQVYYDGNMSYIVWQVGDYTLDVIGTVSKDEIRKIAESVTLLEE
ncbi:DUF4367 domain-containing protein [Anaerovoracaceae bacterium 42-11]